MFKVSLSIQGNQPAMFFSDEYRRIYHSTGSSSKECRILRSQPAKCRTSYKIMTQYTQVLHICSHKLCLFCTIFIPTLGSSCSPWRGGGLEWCILQTTARGYRCYLIAISSHCKTNFWFGTNNIHRVWDDRRWHYRRDVYWNGSGTCTKQSGKCIGNYSTFWFRKYCLNQK